MISPCFRRCSVGYIRIIGLAGVGSAIVVWIRRQLVKAVAACVTLSSTGVLTVHLTGQTRGREIDRN